MCFCSECEQELGEDRAVHLMDCGGVEVDGYGNPTSGDRLINCCFPDCGCPGARLCMAEKGPSSSACSLNIEPGTYSATVGFLKSEGGAA